MFSTIRYVLFLKLTSLYQMIRESLHNYIYNEIIPKYAVFDKAHHEDHALAVIDRALSMGRQYNINEEMLLTAAACHDLGLAIDRKTHHLESGRIIRADYRLTEWFSSEQIEVIAQAAEDHRASSKIPPRSIYGESHWQRTLEHLHEKYAEGGYLHLLIPGSSNEVPLQQLREIIKDEPRLRLIFDFVFAEESKVD